MSVSPASIGAASDPRRADEDLRDLGFGSVVSRASGARLLNRDGTFNVKRRGLSWITSLSVYHWLLTVSWPRFFGVAVLFYLASNAAFAVLFMAAGPDALVTPPDEASMPAYARAFFFSVQTFATIGYGHVHPSGVLANVLVTTESLYGVLGFALLTGILFARFSRPTAKILFSDRAVVAPFGGGSAIMFRLVNGRRSELIDLDARVVLSRFERVGGSRRRRYATLALERHDVAFFPLGLTLVHVIDERSPLFGVSAAEFLDAEGELLVLVRATDEGMSQAVHTRTSYHASEIAWGAKFMSLYDRLDGDGMLSIDVGRLHDIEPTPLPASSPAADRGATA